MNKLIIDLQNRSVKGYCNPAQFKVQIQELKKIVEGTYHEEKI